MAHSRLQRSMMVTIVAEGHDIVIYVLLAEIKDNCLSL